MSKFGYHLTTENNLYGIKKYGLVPRIGRRSFHVRENNKLVCFMPTINCIKYWINQFDSLIDSAKLVILKFNIEDIDYVKRNPAEFITENTIPSDKIKIIFLNNLDIEYNLSDYETELIVNEEALFEKLYSIELLKKVSYYDPILFTASFNKAGKLILDSYQVERLERILRTPYELFFKNDLIEKIVDIYYTIVESNILYKYDVSDEWLFDLLLKMEYENKKAFCKSLLNYCDSDHHSLIISKNITDKICAEHEFLINSDFSKIDINTQNECAASVKKILDEIRKDSKANKTYYKKANKV